MVTVCYRLITEWKLKIHKHMIIDIGTSEQLIGRRRNQKENQKHLEINDIGNTAHQWEITKAGLWNKFMAINTYIKEKERSQEAPNLILLRN